MSTTQSVMPMLRLNQVSMNFRGIKALTDVSFEVRPKQIYSIIGPNGAGKTTILNCISGRYTPNQGQVFLKEQDITHHKASARASLGICRTFQNIALFRHLSVLDNILIGRHHQINSHFLKGGLYWLFGAQKEEMNQRKFVENIIDFLEISHIRNAEAGTLSYGLRKRVELARALAVGGDLILLDEPMAGMNYEEKEDMARYITDLAPEFAMTAIMIEHDIRVVMDMSDRVLVLDFGKTIAEGEPQQVAENPYVQEVYMGVNG